MLLRQVLRQVLRQAEAGAKAGVQPWAEMTVAPLQPVLDLLRPESSTGPGEEPAPARAAAEVEDALAAAKAELVSLPPGDLNWLPDLPAYHRANLELVAGRLRGLSPAGREVALGLIAGRRARVAAASLKRGQAFVGENSRVDASAELHGAVVISADVVVDRAAVITDSLILPHSYVGERVEVTNAIISGNELLRVDSGARLTVADAFLLSDLGRFRGVAGNQVLDRVGAGLLLLLSLPLWPLALLASAVGRLDTGTATDPTIDQQVDARGRAGAGYWRRERLIGNRCAPSQRGAGLQQGYGSGGAFSSWRFATRVPVLAKLPRLLAVLSGDLRLIGVAPLSPLESEQRTEDWQHVRDQAPVGLLGPTQLLLPAQAPLEERLMSDAFYVAQRGRWKDLRWLWVGLRAFFSARAWGRA